MLRPTRRKINIYYPKLSIPLLNIKKAVVVVEKSNEKIIIIKILETPEKADERKTILII